MGRLFARFGALALLLLGFFAVGTVPSRAAQTIAPCRAPVASQVASDRPVEIKFACPKNQTRLGPGDYRVGFEFAPIAVHPSDPLVFRHTSVWQDGATVRFHFADGTEERLSYTSESAADYLEIGAIFQYPVPWRAAPLTGITVETDNSANLRGIVLGAGLEARSVIQARNLKLSVLYAAFAGMVLALLVFNLSLFAAMRQRFQEAYCGMTAALGAYMFTSSGAIMFAFPALANTDRIRLNYVLLALAAVSGQHFIRHFFGEQVFGRNLRLAMNVTAIVSVAGACGFALFAPQQIWLLDRLYFYGLGGLLLLIVPVLLAAWRARSKYFWLFLIAWSAPLTISLLRFAHGLNLIEYSFLLDNGNLVAMAIESLLSAALVTARLRDLGQERDLALVGEQHARRLANTDPLTGLLNRRAFLDLAIGRRARHRLMLIDIDHFKAINDRIGHAGGDDVLRAVSEVIQACRPQKSLAVRLGGEEFALLLPVAVAGSCSAESVLQAVRNHPMPQGAKVTISLGHADGSLASEEDWKRLYRLADAALYRAKSDGRDRSCRATDFRIAA